MDYLAYSHYHGGESSPVATSRPDLANLWLANLWLANFHMATANKWRFGEIRFGEFSIGEFSIGEHTAKGLGSGRARRGAGRTIASGAAPRFRLTCLHIVLILLSGLNPLVGNVAASASEGP